MQNLYRGQKIKLIKKEKMTEDSDLYTFKLPKILNFTPGQFVILSAPGAGEIPLAPCSNPLEKKYLQLSIKKVGLVTNYLDQITDQGKNLLEIRGPYGNGFPIKYLKNKDIILIAGGTALPPIASLIELLNNKRKSYGKIYLLYGVKSSKELIFKKQINRWKKNIKIILCAEEIDQNWEGETGIITGLIQDIDVNPEKSIVIMCGPSVMYAPIVKELKAIKIKPSQVFVSMEARMKCGIGKCQHCTIGKHYTCLDGPVFRYSNIMDELE